MHKMHTAQAGFITKSMGFPLGEGKAKPSIAKKSWCEDSFPPAKKESNGFMAKAVLSPTKEARKLFSGADTGSSRKTVCWWAHPEHAQFERHATEHAHFKVII